MSTDDRAAFLAVACCVLLLAASIGALSGSMPRATPDATNETAGEASEFDRIHDAGVTGENVSVGVVDVTGFDTGDEALAEQVVAARAFGPGATVPNGGHNDHGTAAAARVAETAPDADLYLAAFESPDGYAAAVEWLLSEDVDVVVAPMSAYGKPGDGSARVARVAAQAAREGTVFVAPVGNLARSHWEGRYDPVRNGTLLFEDGPRNHLLGDGREVVVWLSWDRDHREQDYTVELYRADGEEARLVARSVPYRADAVPNERIVARPRPGTYFLVVRGPPDATNARLEITSPTHDLQHHRPSGSIVAPATGRGVLAVGAYDPRSDRVEPFSSRGPTADGRTGVDVVAPDRQSSSDRGEQFVGSSAAAPYAGGVAALVLDAAPCLSPSEVERRLEDTAVDVAEPGPDRVAGHGRVRPWPTVSEARGEC